MANFAQVVFPCSVPSPNVPRMAGSGQLGVVFGDLKNYNIEILLIWNNQIFLASTRYVISLHNQVQRLENHRLTPDGAR